MATQHSTSKARTGRNAASTGSLPNGVIDVIEAQRESLEIALALLTGIDATLQLMEEGGGDGLDETDPADALVLKARHIARPIELVRLAIQRVYQAHSGLDSYNIEKAVERRHECGEPLVEYSDDWRELWPVRSPCPRLGEVALRG